MMSQSHCSNAMAFFTLKMRLRIILCTLFVECITICIFAQNKVVMSEKEKAKPEKDLYSFWIKTDTRIELEAIAKAEYRNLPAQINLALDTYLKQRKSETNEQ